MEQDLKNKNSEASQNSQFPYHGNLMHRGLSKRLIRYKKTIYSLILLVFLTLIAQVSVLVAGSQGMIKMIAVISITIDVLISEVFPFVYVLKTGKYLKGVFYFWALGVFSLIFVCLVLPNLLCYAKPELADVILNSFPEGLIIGPVLILGWLPGLIWCGIAYSLRFIFLYFFRKFKIERL